MSENSEKFLQEAKKWVGRETDITWGRYPVEYEPIRRWCRMVDLANPLYMDEEFARKTKWGGCLCPPLMIPLFSGVAEGAQLDWPFPTRDEDNITPPTPGKRNLGVGNEFKFFKPVRVGERLGSKRRLVDVYIKPTRFDPETFWLVRETSYLNQNKEIVATRRSQSIRFRSPESQPKEATATAPPAQGSTPQADKGFSLGEQLYFEDIQEGKEIAGYSLHLNHLRFYLQASGSQIFGPFHTDEEFARSQGLPTVFVDASFTQAALNRIIAEWMGVEGWLLRLYYEMRKPNFLGDTMAVRGKVARKYLSEGKGCIDFELWIENEREISTSASATVQLPQKVE